MLLAMFGDEAEALLRTIRQRHSREASLLAGDVDAARAERIRELVKIVQESRCRRDRDRGRGNARLRAPRRRAGLRRRAARARAAGRRGRHDPVLRLPRRGRRRRRGRSGSSRRWSGVFYRAADPDSPPFVEVGDVVVAGQTLCLIEAMKLFNEHQGRDATAASSRSTSRTRPPSSSGRCCSSSSRSPRRPRRSETDVPAGPRREPGRDRRPRDPCPPRARDRGRRRVLDRRPRGAARQASPTRPSASGRPSATESYLRFANVVGAAETTGCEAVHPGYGFLAENSGLRPRLRRQRHRLHRPVPRRHGPPRRQGTGEGRDARCRRPARAGHGGHGRGGGDRPRGGGDRLPGAAQGRRRRRRQGHAPRRTTAVDLEDAFGAAQAEARAAFGDGSMYLEKAVIPARHVEIQVICDTHGERADAGRARVLDPAAPPEADRGVALAGADARDARGDGGRRRARLPSASGTSMRERSSSSSARTASRTSSRSTAACRSSTR